MISGCFYKHSSFPMMVLAFTWDACTEKVIATDADVGSHGWIRCYGTRLYCFCRPFDLNVLEPPRLGRGIACQGRARMCGLEEAL